MSAEMPLSLTRNSSRLITCTSATTGPCCDELAAAGVAAGVLATGELLSAVVPSCETRDVGGLAAAA